MAIVEFALLFPIVLGIMFGIFEFGLAFWRKQELTSAVREGARAGIVATNPRVAKATITTKVTDYLNNVGLNDGSRTADCSGCPCAASGSNLTVTATYPTSFRVLYTLSKIWGGTGITATKTLTATVVMQCE